MLSVVCDLGKVSVIKMVMQLFKAVPYLYGAGRPEGGGGNVA